MTNKRKSYLLGDGLKRGNQMLRKLERDQLNTLGTLEVFNPWDQPINDKSKAPTAEQIFETDTKAILASEVIVADCDNDSVGSTTEIGIIFGLNYMHDQISEILKTQLVDGSNNHEVLDKIHNLLEEIPKKSVLWHTSDIRHTQIPEQGLRRSFSMNQYLYGCLLALSGKEKTFEEILEVLKKEN